MKYDKDIEKETRTEIKTIVENKSGKYLVSTINILADFLNDFDFDNEDKLMYDDEIFF